MGIDKDTAKSKTDNWGHIKYKIENDDICSQANTILKMAKKRAQVDATLTVASLSEIFTQDIEDMAQFQERENIENMKADEVVNIQVRFGKHKGRDFRPNNEDCTRLYKMVSSKRKRSCYEKGNAQCF